MKRDEKNRAVNLEALLMPTLGNDDRPPQGAMATAASLKRRSSLGKAASALRAVGGWDPGDCSDNCRRVFPLYPDVQGT